MKKIVLVVAAHPDDELLGAGATLIRHVEEGDIVHALILGEGVAARGEDTEAIAKLREQSKQAAKIAGFSSLETRAFPDNAFDTVSLLSIVKEVEKRFAEVKPDIVYTHCPDDLNVDHRRTFEAVLTASRPVSDFAPREILVFETLSSTEWQRKDLAFKPTHYVNVEKTIERKIEALMAYASEMRPYPHSRSPEGVRILSQFRGLESGLRHAEAFAVVRNIKL